METNCQTIAKPSASVESSGSKNQKTPRADSKAKGPVVLSQAVNRATNLQLIELAFHAHGTSATLLSFSDPSSRWIFRIRQPDN